MERARPHIIFLAYYFPPAEQVGGLRPFRFFKYLRRLGYPCHVITASKQSESSPEVVFVPDKTSEIWHGKKNGRFSFRTFLELLIRKLVFPGEIGILWSFDAAASCRRIIQDHPGCKFVLLSSYPPHNVLLAALILRMSTRIAWIADFRDPLPDLVLQDIPRRVRFSNRTLENRVFLKSNAVLANTDSAAALLRKVHPQAGSKLHVIYNGFDPEDVPNSRSGTASTGRVILHAGALYYGRNPNLLLASLSRLRQCGIPEALSTRIVLLGSLDSQSGLDRALSGNAEREGWLEIRPAVPKSELQQIMEQASGLLLLQPQTRIQIPAKLFEYICIGRPILAIIQRSSAAEHILERAAIPHVCLYSDDDSATCDRKLEEFLRIPPVSSPYSDWFRDNFNARRQVERLATIIEAIE